MERLQMPRFDRITIGRNESWLSSIWLSLCVSFYWLPESLFEAVWPSVSEIFGGIFRLIVGFLGWCLGRFLLMVFGVAGYVRILRSGEQPSDD